MKFQNVNGRRYYEDEEKQWLIENYPVLGITETTKQFNEKFGHDKKISTLKRYCVMRLGLKVSDERKAHRYDDQTAKVGDTYRNCRGEWKIKTESGWKPLSHIHGDVPKGCIAYHLDGNLDNNDKDNIAVIRNGIQTIIRNEGLQSENSEITRTAVCWAELYSLLKKEKK